MQAFLTAETSDPHRPRARAILVAHPEIAELFGRSHATLYVVLALLALQLCAAAFVRDTSLLVLLVLAVSIGALASHALYAAIHECAHGLVLANKRRNLLLAILANVPLVFPFAVSYAQLHLRHHLKMGEADRDPDLPARWEARCFGEYLPGKLLWLLFNPIFQSLRATAGLSSLTVLNIALIIAADAAIALVLGPKAMIYLAVSFAASLILPPIGARYIQEHFVFPEAPRGQETFSYYGPLNALSLNIGYHNEHHDFPSVPWQRLPALRRIALEHYEPLFSHRSWIRVWLRFLVDPRITLYSRYVR